jgi:8-oxo-dGTP diphosphatase
MTHSGSTPRAGAIVDVHILFERDGKYLLLRRFNTGFCDGAYSLPAGHVEEGESACSAAKREALEEVGVGVTDAEMVHMMHHNSDTARISLFFKAKAWRDELVNGEPHKCDDMAWFPKNHLADNVVPYVRFALQHIEMNVSYSEYGW